MTLMQGLQASACSAGPGHRSLVHPEQRRSMRPDAAGTAPPRLLGPPSRQRRLGRVGPALVAGVVHAVPLVGPGAAGRRAPRAAGRRRPLPVKCDQLARLLSAPQLSRGWPCRQPACAGIRGSTRGAAERRACRHGGGHRGGAAVARGRPLQSTRRAAAQACCLSVPTERAASICSCAMQTQRWEYRRMLLCCCAASLQRSGYLPALARLGHAAWRGDPGFAQAPCCVARQPPISPRTRPRPRSTPGVGCRLQPTTLCVSTAARCAPSLPTRRLPMLHGRCAAPKKRERAGHRAASAKHGPGPPAQPQRTSRDAGRVRRLLALYGRRAASIRA